MERIGLYEQLTEFTNEGAGTAEWCTARRDGKEYFVKKFQKPVYPSKELGLAPDKYQTRVKKYHDEENRYKALYEALRSNNASGAMIVPNEIVTYQFHICTIAELFQGNIKPERVHELSPWQRLVLMRTLTLALIGVHKAGIVHGDMKPENLLISQNVDSGMCRLRLIDFDGSYFVKNAPKRFDDVLGDMAYWAPEIYAKYDHEEIVLNERVDDFALGLILHYLWCGTLPSKPKDQTVGQYVYSGGVIKVDTAIVPLVIAKTIEGLLAADPKKRISCEQVYSILGVQLDQYPKEIITLASEERTSDKGKQKKEPEKKTEHEKKTEPGEVSVVHVDTNGSVLKREYYKYDGHPEKTVEAVEINGYERIGMERQLIRFNKDGMPDQSTVTFRYKKKSSAGPWILGIAAAIIIYLIVVYSGYSNAESIGDMEKAYSYSRFFPCFETFFPDKSNSVQYGHAVTLYHNAEYSSANEIFVSLPQSYDDTAKYVSLCKAHKSGTFGMYNFLVDNIGFEDATALLLKNDDFVYMYFVGTWKVNGSSTNTMVVRDNGGGSYTITDLPDRPGSGTWSVSDGILYFTPDEGTRTALHNITITSRDSMTFKGYRTGKSYTLTRK